MNMPNLAHYISLGLESILMDIVGTQENIAGEAQLPSHLAAHYRDGDCVTGSPLKRLSVPVMTAWSFLVTLIR